MQIYEVKNDIAEILYAPDENNLFLSDFLFLEDNESTIVSQVTDISTTERPDVNVATVKFYLSVDKENRLTQYNGHTPSKNAEVGYLDAFEITGLFKPKSKEILWGSYIRNPELKISTDLKFLSSNCCVLCDRAEQSVIFSKNLLHSLNKANVRSLLLDFDGKYKHVKSTQSVTFGSDYRIPLNSKALDYIFENDLNDCPIDAKVIIQNIILEIQKFVESIPEGFLPFEHFLSIIMNECKSSNNSGLLIFCNKLLKYKQKKIFADKASQFESINECQGSFKIDISDIDSKYHNLILNSIISTIQKKLYVITDISEEIINSETLKHIYDNQNIRLIPIISYEDKYLNKIKSYCRNSVFFAPTSRKNFDESYNSFVEKLSPNEFILCGESTLYIPLIVTLKVIGKEELSKNSKAFDEISNSDLDDLDFINENGDSTELNSLVLSEKDLQEDEEQEDDDQDNEIEIQEQEEETTEPEIIEEIKEQEVEEPVVTPKVEVVEDNRPIAKMPKANSSDKNPLRFDMEKLLGKQQSIQNTQQIQPAPTKTVAEVQQSSHIQELKKVEQTQEIVKPVEKTIIEEKPQIIQEEITEDTNLDKEPIPVAEEVQDEEPIEIIDEPQEEIIEEIEIQEEPELQEQEEEIIIEEEPEEVIEEPQIQEQPRVEEQPQQTEPKVQVVQETQPQIQQPQQAPAQAAAPVQQTVQPQNQTQQAVNKEAVKQPTPQPAQAQQVKHITQQKPQAPKKPVPNADELPIYEPKTPEKTVEVFEEGARVMHAKYGAGTVEEIIKYGNKNFCSIQFDSYGRKLLDPKITTLEKI